MGRGRNYEDDFEDYWSEKRRGWSGWGDRQQRKGQTKEAARASARRSRVKLTKDFNQR